MRLSIAPLLLGPLLCLGHGSALADEISGTALLRDVARVPPARLLGGGPPGGQSGGGPRGGALLGSEGGGAGTLADGPDSAHGSFTFGARAGWAFDNGLALHVRYDYLGVEPSPLRSPLQAVTAGARYSFTFLVPLPFVEVDLGPAFAGDVRFGGAAGLGVSIPLGRHVLVDLAARDWLVPIAGELRQTLTGSLGVTVTFAAPSQ